MISFSTDVILGEQKREKWAIVIPYYTKTCSSSEGECIIVVDRERERDSQPIQAVRFVNKKSYPANKSHKALRHSLHPERIGWMDGGRCSVGVGSIHSIVKLLVMISKHRLREHAKSQFNGLIFALCLCRTKLPLVDVCLCCCRRRVKVMFANTLNYYAPIIIIIICPQKGNRFAMSKQTHSAFGEFNSVESCGCTSSEIQQCNRMSSVFGLLGSGSRRRRRGGERTCPSPF